MLSYQHGYHAGNFADVIKHFTLTRVLSYLSSKDKPLLYLETHSGRGMYDFKDGQALKTKEFQDGVSLLWEQRQNLPATFASYLAVLKKFNPTDNLRYYPGSPAIAIEMLREQDRLICCELHPTEFHHLSSLPMRGKKVHYAEADGVQQMLALLPPFEKRGLIFIDPTFEVKSEYKELPKMISKAYKRFATGTFCLWYPIVDRRMHEQLTRGLQAIGAEKTVQLDFYLSRTPMPGMYGCGLWLCNPPYTLTEELKTGMDTLRTLFNPGQSYYTIQS